MIVVKVELWPFGREDKAEEIGRTYIANIGGTTERGDYDVAMCRRGTKAIPRFFAGVHHMDPEKHPTATRVGKVHN